MKRKTIFILVFALSCVSYRAMAWHNFAHGSIAYMAEQHLTPEAKAKCAYYLRHTLSHYASWMDAWRLERFESVNKSHVCTAMPDGVNVDFTGGDPAGGVMGYLVNALAELGDGKYKNLPDSVVRQRLINMIHYVADMHCPSHCGFPERIHLPSSKYDLKRNGKFANFHSFWDGSIGAWRKGWTLKKYVEKIDNITPNESKKWQKGLEQKDLQKGIDSWGKGIIKRAHRAYAILPEGTDLAKLTNEQKAQVHELADESILIGGYRLAYVLNTIFKE